MGSRVSVPKRLAECTCSLLYGKWIHGQRVHNHTYSD